MCEMKRNQTKDQVKTRTSSRTATRSRQRGGKTEQFQQVQQPSALKTESDRHADKTLPFDAEKTLSPIKNSQTFNNDRVTTNPLETPKHPKSSSVCKKTPTGPEDSFSNNFSQHDPNRLVVWDCSSPEAVSFIRHKRRRRHASDVSDIIQNLIIPEEDGEDDVEKESLLGKWLETKPLGPDLAKADNRISHKASKRKEKSRRHKKDSNLQNDLLQKLQRAMVDASEKQNITEKDDKNATHCSQKGLDGSRDLFESVLESSVAGKRSDKNCPTGQSDTSWSEDDFFDNVSFIIKATQNPEEFLNSKHENSSNSKNTGSHKRKTSGNSVEDQPQKKVVKYAMESPKTRCLKQKPPVPSNRTKPCDKNSLKLDKHQNKKATKSGSPFRKFRSFEDDKKGGSSFREDNIQKIKPVNTPVPFLKKNEIKIEPAVTKYNSNNRSSMNSYPTGTNVNTKPLFCSQNQSQKAVSVHHVSVGKMTANQGTQGFSVSRMNQRSNVPTKPCGSFYKAGNSDSQIGSNQSYSQFKTMKSQRQHPNTAKTEIKETATKSVVCSPTANSIKKRVGQSSASKKDINKRHSAGNLDTSLSDDLLCQLAESDEVFESQVPLSQVSKVKVENVETSERYKGAIETKKINSGNSLSTCKPVPCVSQLANKQSNRSSTFSIKSKPKENSINPVEVQNAEVKASAMKNVKLEAKSIKSKDTCFLSCSTAASQVTNAAKNRFSFKPTASQISGAKFSAVSVKTESPAYPPDSEDLFTSDEDDGLSEPQILALLDDVELKATQAGTSSKVDCQNHDRSSKLKKAEDTHRSSQKDTLVSDELDNGLSSSQLSNSQSPFKCTPEEIEQKRLAALSKLKKKSSVSKTPESDDGESPFKCSGERALKVVTPNKKSGSSSSSSITPNKCSPSEIEQKKKAALARRRQKSGALNASPSLTDGANLTSPSKLLQEEIERKKQAALKLREERQRASRNLTSSWSSCSNLPSKR